MKIKLSTTSVNFRRENLVTVFMAIKQTQIYFYELSGNDKNRE